METLKQRAEKAIADGYTYCIEQHAEDRLINLSDIIASPADHEDKKLILCHKEPRKMTLSDDEISDLIIDKLNNQDEFYSEDWDDALNDCDDLLKQLSVKINANFEKRNFWFESGIEL